MTIPSAETVAPILHQLRSANTRPCVLIVDDQPINIQALYRIFAPDHRLLMATSGEKALALCKEDPPDLILLDVVMPTMGGHEVCTRLKADPETRDIPVIFVTSHTDATEETIGLELGAVDFIAKPVNPSVVRARVKTHLTLQAHVDLLRKMVFIDGLTGVANRRCFDDRLATEWRRAARNATPLALLMVDVDHFKRYNDQYGHQVGDKCLRRVAASIQANILRPADLVARYGGEEFACILPETDFEGAMTLAVAVEKSVRELNIEHADSDTADVVTISLGVAMCMPQAAVAPAGLLALADKQLYRAKHGGRGRACGALQD